VSEHKLTVWIEMHENDESDLSEVVSRLERLTDYQIASLLNHAGAEVVDWTFTPYWPEEEE